MKRSLFQYINVHINVRSTLLICAGLVTLLVIGTTSARSLVLRTLTHWGIVAAAAQAEGEKQLIVIYSTPEGFEPAEVTAHAGESIVMILNRSGIKDLTYSVTLQQGQSPIFSATTELGSSALGNLSLTAGEARVTEATHPEWSCRINVTP
ncbi:MAG: hypothetical protein AB1489_38050 [Acidobacteriota bacterium]